MEFKVLAVGDVVGNPGLERVRRHLRQLKRKTGADFVVVNGENAAVVGITPNQAEDILDAGADCITMVLWLTYDLHFHNYVAATFDIMTIASNLIGLHMLKKGT